MIFLADRNFVVGTFFSHGDLYTTRSFGSLAEVAGWINDQIVDDEVEPAQCSWRVVVHDIVDGIEERSYEGKGICYLFMLDEEGGG